MNKGIVICFIVVVLILLIGGGYFIFNNNKNLESDNLSNTSNPNQDKQITDNNSVDNEI